jgi:nitrous oxidase accessory protein NosD
MKLKIAGRSLPQNQIVAIFGTSSFAIEPTGDDASGSRIDVRYVGIGSIDWDVDGHCATQ